MQAQNNNNLEPKNDKDNPINYYEVIIDVDSFRHLLKEEGNNDWGWNVQIKDNFNYEEKIKDDYVSIGVVGNGNRGKSFLLSKISNFSFPIGYSVKTKGISVKYPLEKMGNQNIVILDSAGFETPVLETSDFKLGNTKDEKKALTTINEIARDRQIVEYFTQKFILTYSNVIIAVVGQLTFSEQQLLVKIKEDNKKKKIFVVHNLFNFETKKQVDDYIENTLLKSLTFKLSSAKYVNFENKSEKELKQENQIYYHEDINQTKSIEHLILSKEGTEAGNYYNNSTLLFLRNNIVSETKVRKIPIIENVKKNLANTSVFALEYPIKKENIKYENSKIFVENAGKPIILKQISTDSLGTSSFYGQAFLPSFNFFIVDNYKEVPELEKLTFNVDEDCPVKEYKNLEGMKIYIIQIELPGIINSISRPSFVLSVDGKMQMTFSGVRLINNEEISEDEKKKDTYNNTIKSGNFSLFFELPNGLRTIGLIYLCHTHIHIDGIITFYYCASGKEDETEELDF